MNNQDRLTRTAVLLASIVIMISILIALAGCGSLKVSGGTTHEVKGHAEVVLKVTVDLSVCDSFEGDAKMACIDKVLDAFEKVNVPEAINGAL